MNVGIAAGHDITADAALEIMRNGGNAVDAAIAAYLVAFVAEPCMASAGGGAFANVRMANGQHFVFDFFCQTPLHKRPESELDFFPVTVDFGTAKETFHIGHGSTATPGSIAGIYAMHEKFGSTPMKVLVQPAIHAAKFGVQINEFQRFDLELLKEIFTQTERGKSLFYGERGLLDIGEKLFMPDLADFLDNMSREGSDLFYRGEIAKQVSEMHAAKGGSLTREDFEQYNVEIRKPLKFNYRNRTVYTNPSPCAGGNILKTLLELVPQDTFPYYEKSFSDYWIDVFKNGMSKVGRTVDKRGSTSHLNVLDRSMNAVSLTTTIGEGCGYFVDHSDIHMNNMLGEAALMPSGFHSWKENSRLSSMMTPTIVCDENDLIEIILGTGGASRIPGAIAQVLHYMIDHKMEAYNAVNAPRCHYEHGIFNYEAPIEVRKELDAIELNEWSKQSLFFGGVHTIQRCGKALYAAGDERRDGVIRIEAL